VRLDDELAIRESFPKQSAIAVILPILRSCLAVWFSVSESGKPGTAFDRMNRMGRMNA
jgi:hypothetical protein